MTTTQFAQSATQHTSILENSAALTTDKTDWNRMNQEITDKVKCKNDSLLALTSLPESFTARLHNNSHSLTWSFQLLKKKLSLVKVKQHSQLHTVKWVCFRLKISTPQGKKLQRRSLLCVQNLLILYFNFYKYSSIWYRGNWGN